MSKIPWCDITINPIVGCTKISAGCQNCYAEKMAWRLKCMGIPKYQDVVDENGWTGKIGFDFSCSDKIPRSLKSPKRIFIGSMCDIFHPNVPTEIIKNVLKATLHTYFLHHTFMFLTKRPERMAEIIKKDWGPWLGVTVEHPDYLWRIDELLKIPAAVRFISVEPMLAPVEFDQFWGALGVGIDWVVIGCESGPRRRSIPIKYIEDLVAQCDDAGVP
ncbi:MAG TPA: DUF5131 family protein, partial [Desulfobacterales bacterium]|nr:DUF5131 family protein [Desulfobacterales bacterium]